MSRSGIPFGRNSDNVSRRIQLNQELNSGSRSHERQRRNSLSGASRADESLRESEIRLQELQREAELELEQAERILLESSQLSRTSPRHHQDGNRRPRSITKISERTKSRGRRPLITKSTLETIHETGPGGVSKTRISTSKVLTVTDSRTSQTTTSVQLPSIVSTTRSGSNQYHSTRRSSNKRRPSLSGSSSTQKSQANVTRTRNEPKRLFVEETTSRSSLSSRSGDRVISEKTVITEVKPSYVTSTRKERQSLPKRPDLRGGKIEELLEKESADVTSSIILEMANPAAEEMPCIASATSRGTVGSAYSTRELLQRNMSPEVLPELPEPDPDDIQPEVAAAIMFAEEKGFQMWDSPRHTVEHLFPPSARPRKLSTIKVSSVVSSDFLKNVVVPTDNSPLDSKGLVTDDMAAVDEEVVLATYSKSVESKDSKRESPKRADLMNELLGQDIDEVEDLDYLLHPERPDTFTSVQLRGNTQTWFPGYFMAFPNQPDGIRLAKSPSEVFRKAWHFARPTGSQVHNILVVRS